jgi:uncharacterized protein
MRKLITTLLILLSFTVPTLSSADDAGKLDESAAEQGDADAQYRLALMYFVGEGTPQDFKAAIKWHKKAAEQGHAQS